MERPIIYYDGCGESGNIYWLLGALQLELRKRNMMSVFNDAQRRVLKAKNYNEAISTISEYAELIDTSI